MERKDAINMLRKASAAHRMWANIGNDGPRTAYVEHSAAVSLNNAIKRASRSGLTPDEIANETLIPYRTVWILTR